MLRSREQCHQRVKITEMPFSRAFRSTNEFGTAQFQSRYQIDKPTALAMFGFKAQTHFLFLLLCFESPSTAIVSILLCQIGVCDAVWNEIRKHLHAYRQETAGRHGTVITSACQRPALFCPCSFRKRHPDVHTLAFGQRHAGCRGYLA